MLRVILCVLLAVGAFSFPPKTNPLRDSDWELFKLTYSKVYSLSEEIRRRVAWENNLDMIEKHNAEYENGKHTYTLGVNAYADLTSQEFVRQMNGYRMDLKKPSGATFVPPSSLGDLPNTVDWRTKGYVTGVKDQKACGGCWAFSATGSLEGQHFRKNHTLVSMSEQNLIDCSRDLGNMGCEGGLMNLAFEYIRVNVGIDTEASYPFIAKDGRCNFSRANVAATDVGFIDIKKNSEDDLKTAVATVGPISVAIDASEQTFQLYHSGVYNQPKCSTTQLDHAVLAVGYGVLNGTDYWLVKNSWGTSWGMDGYIMMSRNKGNQCGIAAEASYPRVFGHPPREV